ncbi:MAG: IPT/TIG domain-containing protein [Planctomycetota bacterium]
MAPLLRVLTSLAVFALPLAAQTATPSQGPARSQATGQRQAPPLTVTPALDFGGLQVGGQSAAQTITITNHSGADVTLGGVGLVGDAGDFVSAFVPALPFVLPAGQSEVASVTFEPQTLGGKSAGLQVTYEGAPGIPVTAPLAGVALGAPGDEVRVNAGGTDYIDGLTQEWTEDFGFAGGGDKYVVAPVGGTTEPILYRDRRFGASFDYSFPLPAGSYDVTLLFAELELPFPGARVFDVLAEGVVVVDDLDLAGLGLFGQAYTQTLEVEVSDGVLDLEFTAGVGEAIVSGIEVTGVARITATPTALDFGAVASFDTAQMPVTLENVGLVPVTISTLSLLLGPAGTPASMSVDVSGEVFPGVGGDISYPLSQTLEVGETLVVDVTFGPTVDQYDQCILRLEGDFDPVEVTLAGLGGHVGHPYLHVVIDVEQTVVDYDGDGFEDVICDGSTSHTHEPGAGLSDYAWTDGVTPLGSGPVITPNLALGAHTITLEIFDDNEPVGSLIGDASFDIVPSTDVPGVLVLYHDASGVPETPADMVLSPPVQPDYVELVSTTRVDGLTSIGTSPYTQNVMLRMLAKVNLDVAGTYDFVAEGGAQRVVYVNGLAMTGPVALAAGVYDVDARFAIDGVGQIPVEVLMGLDGAEPGAIDAAALVHDESGLPPIINTMPTLGTSLGGNQISIEGLGFFPYDQVVVHWGGQQFTETFFDSISADEIVLTSPPGSGLISVQVETPQGMSNAVSFTYDQSGPVPINFTSLGNIGLTLATAAAWGPDGIFYVAGLDGRITGVDFDDNYAVISKTTYDGVSALSNHDVLGIAVNPFDPPTPVRLYVAHAEHFVNGGSTFTGPSPYTGQISILEGPAFDTPIPYVTQLPTSNHDHAVNGLTFDNNGDLLICVGSNTNAGVKHPNSGDLVESPLSAAILKAETSRPDFNGAITYSLTSSGLPSTDQVEGESVDVDDDVHVDVHAVGLRNPYDLVLATNRRLYSTDNGPNFGFGAASTGPVSEEPDPQDKDEILLIEYGNYYGSPNRGRGRYDPRQNVYRNATEPEIAGEFTQALTLLSSSMDGIDEYRANTFQGQLRGDLVAQKMGSYTYRIDLTEDGRSTNGWSQLTSWSGALGVKTGPGGAIIVLGHSLQYIRVYVPDDLAAVGLVVHDVFPWRGPETGGTPFEIGGVGFGTTGNTSVTFDGIPATIIGVSPNRIRGLTPANLAHGGELVDIEVTVGVASAALDDAYRYLYPAGNEPGWWETDLTDVPVFLGEVSAGVIGGVLYLVGEGAAGTFRYDIPSGTWLTNGATRPFVGHHHSAEVVDGKLYLMGGLEAGSEGRVQIYDPVLDTWTVGADMPWGGGSASSAAIGGQIYVAGGIVGTTVETQSTVVNHAVYDPVLDAWTVLADMPAGRNHAAAATDGTRFYVFGGRDGANLVSNGFDDVQVYDPVADTWEWSGDGVSGLAPLPQARGGMGKAVFYQDELYVFGGETQSGAGAIPGKGVYDRVDVYDPVTNTWRAEAPMPTPRHGISPVLFQSRMFLAAGGTNAGASGSTVLDLFTRQ